MGNKRKHFVLTTLKHNPQFATQRTHVVVTVTYTSSSALAVAFYANGAAAGTASTTNAYVGARVCQWQWERVCGRFAFWNQPVCIVIDLPRVPSLSCNIRRQQGVCFHRPVNL